jgi:hypothetical protein
MKKNLKTFIAIALATLGVQLAASPPSNAILTVGMGGSPLMVLGLLSIIAGGVGPFDQTNGNIFTYDYGNYPGGYNWLAIFLGGIIILDKQGDAHVTFQALNPQQAQTLGLSSELTDAFNDNIDQINMTYSTMEHEMKSSGIQFSDPSAVKSQGNAIWEAYKGDLDPQAALALQTVLQQKSNTQANTPADAQANTQTNFIKNLQINVVQ